VIQYAEGGFASLLSNTQNRGTTTRFTLRSNNEPRSVYSRAVYGNVIAIIDHDQGRSVTNDAANVINDLVREGFDLSQYRVIYRDTRGIWDQVLVDRTGQFAGFSSINERDLRDALASSPGIDPGHGPRQRS
jgi:hypothetical protein